MGLSEDVVVFLRVGVAYLVLSGVGFDYLRCILVLVYGRVVVLYKGFDSLVCSLDNKTIVKLLEVRFF